LWDDRFQRDDEEAQCFQAGKLLNGSQPKMVEQCFEVMWSCLGGDAIHPLIAAGKLTLEDFDWQNEILTVRRSKRGRTQQFPLVFEVGEAIIRYLRLRPKCQFREVFLTLHTPFRPAKNFSGAVRKVLHAQNTFDRPWGLHAFRHACATELLRKGTPLRGIADFLGHRDIQSVSIYAHSDLRALREVANLDLERFLCD